MGATGRLLAARPLSTADSPTLPNESGTADGLCSGGVSTKVAGNHLCAAGYLRRRCGSGERAEGGGEPPLVGGCGGGRQRRGCVRIGAGGLFLAAHHPATAGHTPRTPLDGSLTDRSVVVFCFRRLEPRTHKELTPGKHRETSELQSPQPAGCLRRDGRAPERQYSRTHKSDFTKGESNGHPHAHTYTSHTRTQRPYTPGHVRANQIRSRQRQLESPDTTPTGHPTQRGTAPNQVQ